MTDKTPFKFTDNLNTFADRMRSLDYQTLDNLIWLMAILIILDMFGLWWYLKIEKIAIAILIILMVCIGILAILKSGRFKMEEEQEFEDKEKQEKQLEDKEEGSLEFGLPSAEEYQKRMKDAIGF